jgi:UDP:flavonoid glycosyltransferase YjiC (YdhE family)
MSADNLEKTYQLIEQVAKEMSENYFIFTDGNAKKSSIEIQNNLERHAFIPYEPTLQKFDIVIHHGGAGIIHSCIRHKNYQIVLPNMYDQFDYAARLEDKKLGTWLKRKNVNSIIKAINEVESVQPIEVKKEFSKYLNEYNSGIIINGLIDDILNKERKNEL